MKVAAVAILCQDERVFESMIQAGTPCPIDGKIGKEAQALWSKYDHERPDYKTYVKRMDDRKAKEKKIAEAIAKEEARIVTGKQTLLNHIIVEIEEKKMRKLELHMLEHQEQKNI